MKALIKNKQEIANGTLLVSLDLQGENVEFKPGQFFFITLPNIPYQDSKGGRRHFSIVNSPNQKGIIQFATRLRNESAFKKYLSEIPTGSEVEIGPFSGKFILPEDTSKHYVFIAGGIGITPFISMLRCIQEEKLSHKITLIYSNRDQQSTAFLDELNEMSLKNPHLKLILIMTEDPTWTGEQNRIDATFIKKYLNLQDSYLVAGPPTMVTAVETALKEAGVPNNNVIKENFSGY